MRADFVQLSTSFDQNYVSLVRSRLEAADIPTYVPNEYTSALQLPFMFGPLRIYVPRDRIEEARAILEGAIGYEAGAGVPDADDAPGEEAAAPLACPVCGSIDMRPAPRSPLERLGDLVFGSPFRHAPRRLRCGECGEEWSAP